MTKIMTSDELNGTVKSCRPEATGHLIVYSVAQQISRCLLRRPVAASRGGLFHVCV